MLANVFLDSFLQPSFWNCAIFFVRIECTSEMVERSWAPNYYCHEPIAWLRAHRNYFSTNLVFLEFQSKQKVRFLVSIEATAFQRIFSRILRKKFLKKIPLRSHLACAD